MRHRLNLYRLCLLCVKDYYARKRYVAILDQRNDLEIKLKDAKPLIREDPAVLFNARVQQHDAERQALRSGKEASNAYAALVGHLFETIEEMSSLLRRWYSEFRDAEHRQQSYRNPYPWQKN